MYEVGSKAVFFDGPGLHNSHDKCEISGAGLFRRSGVD